MSCAIRPSGTGSLGKAKTSVWARTFADIIARRIRLRRLRRKVPPLGAEIARATGYSILVPPAYPVVALAPKTAIRISRQHNGLHPSKKSVTHQRLSGPIWIFALTNSIAGLSKSGEGHA
jgi:hypothetical protein